MVKQWNDMVENVRVNFECEVYSCEGQPCLTFLKYETLGNITTFLKEKYNVDVLEVFYMSTQN
jgi:hypothetical protein